MRKTLPSQPLILQERPCEKTSLMKRMKLSKLRRMFNGPQLGESYSNGKLCQCSRVWQGHAAYTQKECVCVEPWQGPVCIRLTVDCNAPGPPAIRAKARSRTASQDLGWHALHIRGLVAQIRRTGMMCGAGPGDLARRYRSVDPLGAWQGSGPE